MIFVDEMDAILLKVKSQGKKSIMQERYPSIWPLSDSTHASLGQQLDLPTKISSTRNIENKEHICGEDSLLRTLLINVLVMP